MYVKCEYALESWNGFTNKLYTGWITSASITKIDDRTIKKSISEIHENGKSDSDVEAVSFEETVVGFFPRDLHINFPCLIALSIFNCGLTEISRDDLKDLTFLEAIYLNSNQLKALPDDLFEDMPKLRIIELYGNKLEFISSKLLEPVTGNGLTLADFRGNKIIDAFYWPGKDGSVQTIEELLCIMDASESTQL